MITMSLAKFEVIAGLSGWAFHDEIAPILPTQKMRKYEPDKGRFVVSRTATFVPSVDVGLDEPICGPLIKSVTG